jgi:hypothetical protein
MSVKLWNGTALVSGTVRLADGTGGPNQPVGEILQWPWVGGADLVGELKPVAYGGARGFGGNEFANNTIYAANAFFNDTRLSLLSDRLIGAVDLRILTGTAGPEKLVLSYNSTVTYSGGTGSVASLTEANWNTAVIPSPVGGADQPATFWDNPTYPEKSIAPEWVGKQILAPLIRDANALTPFINWVTAHPGTNNQIIGVSDTYSHCVAMEAANMYAMQRWGSSTPTLSDLQTAAADGMYGVLVSSTYLTGTMVTNAKGVGLKVWVYNADTAALVDSYTSMGVDGIYTTTPIAALTGTIPPPPPSANKTIWGYDSESWADVQGKMADGLLTPRIIRSYNGGSTTANPDINTDMRGRRDPQGNYIAIWDSVKPAMSIMKSAVERENLAVRITNYLTTNIPKGQHVYLTIWHEPEETSATTAYQWRDHFSSLSAWQDAWRAAHTALYEKFVLARADGHKFFVTPLICDWTIWNTSKGSATSWYPLSWTTYDVMGWDIYPTGQETSTTNKQICRLWCDADYMPVAYTNRSSTENPNGQGWYAIETAAKMARDRNKPWGSGECGLVKGYPAGSSYYRYSGRQRAQRFLDMIQHMSNLPNPPLIWSWYDAGGCTLTNGGDPAGSGGGDNWPSGLSIAAWNTTLTPSYNGVPAP